MRLDHLLSKEHHRTTCALCVVGGCGHVHAVRVCSGCSWVEHHQILPASTGPVWLVGVGQTRCWVLGEQAPAALSAFRMCVGVVRVCGWCVCLSWPALFMGSRVGGGVWVGVWLWIWFFHSGREHLGIMTVPHPCWVGVVVVFCVIFVVVVFLVLSDSRCPYALLCGGGVSVQERMVDALASGADEGRGNLR